LESRKGEITLNFHSLSEKIILKWIVNKYKVLGRINLTFDSDQVAGFCEVASEVSRTGILVFFWVVTPN